MSRKHRFFTFTNGKQYPIDQTDSGQLVVKISPEEWEQLDGDQQEAIVQVDILLSREWAGGAFYYQDGRRVDIEPGPPIWQF